MSHATPSDRGRAIGARRDAGAGRRSRWWRCSPSARSSIDYGVLWVGARAGAERRRRRRAGRRDRRWRSTIRPTTDAARRRPRAAIAQQNSGLGRSAATSADDRRHVPAVPARDRRRRPTTCVRVDVYRNAGARQRRCRRSSRSLVGVTDAGRAGDGDRAGAGRQRGRLRASRGRSPTSGTSTTSAPSSTWTTPTVRPTTSRRRRDSVRRDPDVYVQRRPRPTPAPASRAADDHRRRSVTLNDRQIRHRRRSHAGAMVPGARSELPGGGDCRRDDYRDEHRELQRTCRVASATTDRDRRTATWSGRPSRASTTLIALRIPTAHVGPGRRRRSLDSCAGGVSPTAVQQQPAHRRRSRCSTRTTTDRRRRTATAR